MSQSELIINGFLTLFFSLQWELSILQDSPLWLEGKRIKNNFFFFNPFITIGM